MISLKYSAIIVFALMDVACERLQPNYCDLATNHNCLNISADAEAKDSNMGCLGGVQCSAGVCDSPTGTCVQCTGSGTHSEGCTQTTTTPVCGPNHICHACAAHTDCLSRVCLPNGACAADVDVAYIVGYGLGKTEDGCSKDHGCGTLRQALDTKRPYIKVESETGMIVDNTQITVNTLADNHAVTILSDPDGKITSNTGIVLTIKGAVNVKIYDLEIVGSNDTNGEGIDIMSDGSGSPTVHLVHVKIDNHPKIGLNVVMADEISIVRSSIFANKGGGIKISSSVDMFTISNNLISHNGDSKNPSNGSFGGLSFSSPSSSKISELKFNTIVDNFASMNAGGAQCSPSTTDNILSSYNIFWRNRFSVGSPPNPGTSINPQVETSCNLRGSLVDITDVNNNFASFEDPDNNKYHLTTFSPNTIVDSIAKDSSDCRDVDLDGNMRPTGQGCDYGAYERTP